MNTNLKNKINTKIKHTHYCVKPIACVAVTAANMSCYHFTRKRYSSGSSELHSANIRQYVEYAGLTE